MPQVPGDVARARAARLRESGARALRRHLDAQIGKTLSVLTERGGMGRAADFTPVATPGLTHGRIVTMIATGHDGTRLDARRA
jgi:threonylcarbamoyladenosine tRNA methylthiotransferase MtaB